MDSESVDHTDQSVKTTSTRRTRKLRKLTSKSKIIRFCSGYLGSIDINVNSDLTTKISLGKKNGIWICNGIYCDGSQITDHLCAKSSTKLQANDYFNCATINLFNKSKNKYQTNILREPKSLTFENQFQNSSVENLPTLLLKYFPLMTKFEEYIQNRSEIVNFAKEYELRSDTVFKRKKTISEEETYTQIGEEEEVTTHESTSQIISMSTSNENNIYDYNQINTFFNQPTYQPTIPLSPFIHAPLSLSTLSDNELSNRRVKQLNKYGSIIEEIKDQKVSLNTEKIVNILFNDQYSIDVIPLTVLPNSVTHETLEMSISYAAFETISVDVITHYKQFSLYDTHMVELFKNPSNFKDYTLRNLESFLMQYYDSTLLMLIWKSGQYQNLFHKGEFHPFNELNIILLNRSAKFIVLCFDDDTNYFLPVLLKENVCTI
jgi:hypothetical protein